MENKDLKYDSGNGDSSGKGYGDDLDSAGNGMGSERGSGGGMGSGLGADFGNGCGYGDNYCYGSGHESGYSYGQSVIVD